MLHVYFTERQVLRLYNVHVQYGSPSKDLVLATSAVCLQARKQDLSGEAERLERQIRQLQTDSTGLLNQRLTEVCGGDDLFIKNTFKVCSHS